MTRNGHPHIQIMELPVCLVCGKPFTRGQRVMVTNPDMIFIHEDCVDSEDHARELIKRHKESGGE